MSADVEGLAEPLRSRVRALLDESGGKVKILSGRRSRDEQLALRRANCGTSDYDVFDKPAMQCNPPTAKPGESRHEVGLAVDLTGDLELAAQLGAQLGLKRTVTGEPWHFEPAEAAGAADTDRKSGGGGGNLLTSAAGAAAGLVTAPLKPLEAASSFVAVLLRPSTWMRVIGLVFGLVLVSLGVAMIAADLGALSAKGVGLVTGGVDA